VLFRSILLTAARLSIDRADFVRAQDLIARGLKNSFANRSEFIAVARTLGINAFASRKPDLTVAKEALDIVLTDSPRDADAYLLRGRIQLDAAKRENPAAIDNAAKDFAKAREFRQGSATQDLSVVEVELSEAQFLAGRYEEAGREARAFLERNAKEKSGPPPYEAVAHLLQISSEYLLGLIADPARHLQDRVQRYSGWPQLLVKLPTGDRAESVDARLAEWTFVTLDRYICRDLKEREGKADRDAVKKLSDLVQRQLDPKVALRSCEEFTVRP